MQVTMRAGGHNPGARALTSGGILIDQSLRKNVTIVDQSNGAWDFENEEESLKAHGQAPYLRVQAGATHKELYEALDGKVSSIQYCKCSVGTRRFLSTCTY